MLPRKQITRAAALKLITDSRHRLSDRAEALIPEGRDYQPLPYVEQSERAADDACGVRNGFLAEVIYWITGQRVEVTGEPELLYPCPCCGYATLTERHGMDDGGWDICRLCHWEDDGTEDPLNNPTVSEEAKARIRANLGKYSPEKWFRPG